MISPHPLELCGIGHFVFMEFLNSALAGVQNMSGCRILCGSVVIKNGWSLVYDSANLAPGGSCHDCFTLLRHHDQLAGWSRLDSQLNLCNTFSHD